MHRAAVAKVQMAAWHLTVNSFLLVNDSGAIAR